MTAAPHVDLTAPLALRTRIKMCGFTREADVDAAVALGADAIGFVLYPPSPRAVSPQRAAELARRLPPMVTPVLLFVNEDAINVRAACAELTGAVAQFHGDESAADCVAACAPDGRAWWRAAHIPAGAAGRDFDLLQFAERFQSAQALLLDTQSAGFGGSGIPFTWSHLPPSVNAHLVLSGGLNAANVADALAALRGVGRSLAVDVSSGIEEPGRKGVKSVARMREFVAAVRAADAQFLASV